MEKGDQETCLDNDWLKNLRDVLANPTSLHPLDNSSSRCNVKLLTLIQAMVLQNCYIFSIFKRINKI